MKRTWILLGVMGFLVLAGVVLDRGAVASNKIARDTGMVCTECHDKPGSKLMTDKGKYYEFVGSFDGYEEIKAGFSKCTQCHVKKPGSKRLTREGKKFAGLVRDMDGLRDWAKKNHPASAGKK